MKTMLRRLLPVFLGGIGFFLRLLQLNTAFEPDTGLPIPAAPASLAMALFLAAAGVLFLVLSLREAPQKKQDLSAAFHTPPQKMLPVLVCAAMLTAAGGVLLAYDGLKTGDVLQLAVGAVAVISALCLFFALALWRRGSSCGLFLALPALMNVAWLLNTYRHCADSPVLEALYLQILAISAFAYGFYQVAAHSFSLGSSRAVRFILPVSTVLGLAVLADELTLGALCLSVGSTVLLYGFFLLEKPAAAA